jgi:WD40 repeat protein
VDSWGIPRGRQLHRPGCCNALAGLLVLCAVLNTAPASATGSPEVFAQLGHSNVIHALAFAPDGRTLVTGSEDGTAKIWDVAAERELRTLHAAEAAGAVSVNAVAYARGGALVATGTSGGQVLVWESATGRLLHVLKGHTGAVTALAFDPTGAVLASASTDHTVRLWDPLQGSTSRTLAGHRDAVQAVAFSGDGHQLASGSVDKSIKVWDPATGRELFTLSGHADRVVALAFCGPGSTLASGSWDHSVRLWNSTSGTALRTLQGPTSEVWAVACSPDGRVVAAGSYDHTVRTWDVTGGIALHTLAADPRGVESVAFSPDGQLLAAAGGSRTVTLWNARSGQCLKSEAEGKGCASVLTGQAAFVKAVAFSNRSGLMLAAGGADQGIRIWRTADGELLRTFKAAHSPWVGAIAFTPDNKRVASRGGDGNIRLWDLESGKLLRSLVAGNPYAGSASIALSPDGTQLAAGGPNNSVRIWNTADGSVVRTLTGHAASVEAVAYSADGTLLASADAHGVIQLWQVAGGTAVRTLSGHSKWVDALAFSPDGRLLASGGGDASVHLWDVGSGSGHVLSGHRAAVTAVAFAPKDAVLASSDESGLIRLWSVPGGQALQTLHGHADGVESIAFSRDGTVLASASEDSTVRLWDVATASERVRLVSFKDGSTLFLTPQGYYDFTDDLAEENLNVRTGNEVQGISDYRERFYRPDLVQRALGGRKIPPQLPTLATVKAAPDVALLDVPDQVSSEGLDLHVRITDRGGGIGEVRTYLNGAAVADGSARGLEVVPVDGTPARTVHVRLVAARNDIQVIAFNADGSVHSNPAQATVMADLPPSKGQLYALVVGIQDFQNPQFNLRFSVADANAMTDIIRKRAAPLFDKVSVETLTTPQATTKAAIESAFGHYRNVAPGDVFLFYIASHGVVTPDEDNPEYFVITSNLATRSLEAVKRDALGQAELGEMIAGVPATRKLVLLDTCHAGAMGDAMLEHLSHIEQHANIKKLSGAVGSTIISATTSDQEANEGEDGHGLFTWVLLQGLNGSADLGKHGFIKNLDLALYADNEVPKIAEKHFHVAQNPDLHSAGQSFQIASTR